MKFAAVTAVAIALVLAGSVPAAASDDECRPKLIASLDMTILPDGTFAAPVSYAAGYGSDGLAVGDFNGDGKLDLAVVNDYSRNVSIFLGRGDGTFSPAVNFATGYGSSGLPEEYRDRPIALTIPWRCCSAMEMALFRRH